MAIQPSARTSSTRAWERAGAPAIRSRSRLRGVHGALVTAFLIALATGGHAAWAHVPAGITVGLLAGAGLLAMAAGIATRPEQGSVRPAGRGWRRLGRGAAIALLVCLAGLAASGLGTWLSGEPAEGWMTAHEGFRLAALGLLGAHLAGVLLGKGHGSGPPGPAATQPKARETAE